MKKGNRPNVLIIMTDQHRADYMSCAGSSLVPTPNLDRIALRGIRFENAYCAYPVCLASRCAMLTGLYPHTTGAVNNHDLLDWRYRTMAHHFGSSGYITGLVGKMHFNDACNHGFEYYTTINDWLMYLGPKVQAYADEIANHPLNPAFFNTVHDDGAGFPDYANVWKDNKSSWRGKVNKFVPGQVASVLDEEDHLDRFIARESVKFLDKFNGQPFFLVTSFMKPHTPFYPPRNYAEQYPLDKVPLKDIGDSSQYAKAIRDKIANTQNMPEIQRKAARAGYYGNLAFADSCIGIVYDKLEQMGLLDNTIVVYTSDHGEMDGDHGLHQKFCMFDPSVKVPLIVSWPGHFDENAVCGDLVSQLGLYPTLADLAGTGPASAAPLAQMENAPDALDGESFAPSVYEPGQGALREVYSEYAMGHPGQARYMVRSGRHKYVWYETGEEELFDLKTDPGENRNMCQDPGFSAIREQLSGKIQGRLKEWGIGPKRAG